MTINDSLKKVWEFLKADTWQSWIVSIILVIIIIKFIFFPFLSLVTGTKLPLVVVESCSMYHESDFDSWWSQNSAWYESHGINKSDFLSYKLKNGLNKGDIVIVLGSKNHSIGDIIIFSSETRYPLIHRLISLSPLATKGDNNPSQINGLETDIAKEQVLGKAVGRIPALGWIKLIFFEFSKPKEQRGFCR